MNRNTLAASFHEQIDSLKSTSLPQVKHFLRKRIAKCLNECKIQTINMKKSVIGYTSSTDSKTSHHHPTHMDTDYEFGWGSDFEDDQDDEYDEEEEEEVPPPLPKCPPPNDLIEHQSTAHTLNCHLSSRNFYESMPAEAFDGTNDYLVPNQVPFDNPPSEVIDRPLPPIPDQQEIEELKSNYWFHDIEREEAEDILNQIATNGIFLVRKSKRAGICNPYSLTLFFNKRIFHLNIRRRPDQKFALGTEKPKEKTFDSVADLIKYHNKEPIYLTSKGLVAGKTTLISSVSSSCYNK